MTFTPLPDFSKRLQALIRAYGLTGNALSRELGAIGVSCSVQHAYRLLGIDPETVPKLSAELLAGILHVCPVEARYFFDANVGDISDLLESMFVERTEPPLGRPGPRPKGQ